MYSRFRQASLLFVIVIKDTPCYKHSLKEMSVSSKGSIYKLITNDKIAIRKLKEGRNNAIMLAGGPKLIEGHLLPTDNNYKITQIVYQNGNYYIILKKQ